MQALPGSVQVCAVHTACLAHARHDSTQTAHGCSHCCQVAKIQGAGGRTRALCVRAAAPSAAAPGDRRAAVQTAAVPAVKAAALAEVADVSPASTAFTPRPITSVLSLEGLTLPSYGGPLPCLGGCVAGSAGYLAAVLVPATRARGAGFLCKENRVEVLESLRCCLQGLFVF